MQILPRIARATKIYLSMKTFQSSSSTSSPTSRRSMSGIVWKEETLCVRVWMMTMKWFCVTFSVFVFFSLFVVVNWERGLMWDTPAGSKESKGTIFRHRVYPHIHIHVSEKSHREIWSSNVEEREASQSSSDDFCKYKIFSVLCVCVCAQQVKQCFSFIYLYNIYIACRGEVAIYYHFMDVLYTLNILFIGMFRIIIIITI